jgi:hypothetical protein
MYTEWKTTPKLEKLGLRQCKLHAILFSAKPHGFCAKCGPNAMPPAAPTVETKTCSRGHVRPINVKSCAKCASITRAAKKATA